MQQKTGIYLNQNTSGEAYKAYLPPILPPDPPLDLNRLYPKLEKATLALAQLNTLSAAMPNPSLFLYMNVRKEAVLSSQIEGTQSSLADLILFEHQQQPEVVLDDVEEVSNYVKAIHYGLQRLEAGFPLCLRLLKEIHAILLAGSRGSHKLPGEVRRSQNWIGGTRPGNAEFVPPPAGYLAECLSNWEKFLHDETLPVLIKAGIAHVQFETIHPFLDGNGRLGRLLIILLLCANGLLAKPILYFSLYLKENRALYYQLLQEVRTRGLWETWLEFFLEGLETASQQTIQAITNINHVFIQDEKKIADLGRLRFSCHRALEYMKQLPQLSARTLAHAIAITPPTARHTLRVLQQTGIIEEISGKKRDKIYIYRRYLDILAEGTEPL